MRALADAAVLRFGHGVIARIAHAPPAEHHERGADAAHSAAACFAAFIMTTPSQMSSEAPPSTASTFTAMVMSSFTS